MPRSSAYKGPVNIVATCQADESARNRQTYAFANLHNPGDAFLVTHPKAKCKYERNYWQVKISSACAYWKKQQECGYSVRSVPDYGVLVIRTADNHPERRLECQL